MYEQEKHYAGWCGYCKNRISIEERYCVKGRSIYHPECFTQKNTFSASLNDTHDDIARQDFAPDFHDFEDDGSDS